MQRRAGYTLLEVLLAIAIGLFVVAALYVAMDVQLRYVVTGRNAIAEGQLARGLLSRMAADVRLSLALLPKPAIGGTPAPPATTTGETPTAEEQAPTTPTGQFNLGISGNEVQITLFISTLPRTSLSEADVQTGLSDLRRITYWLVPGEGLLREEVKNVTAGDLETDSTQTRLGAEVIDLSFRYYDAATATWVATWDGTTTGPPLAVEITLGVQARPDRTMGRAQEMPISYYRMVVAIPTGQIPPAETTTGTATTPQ